MTRTSSRTSRLRALARTALCALALAACDEGPLAPGAQVQTAGGRLWAAVPAPRDLPDERTWLPYVASRGGAGEVRLRAVHARRDLARHLRRKGDFPGALHAEEEAVRLGAAAVTVVPPRAAVARALGGVDAWLDDAGRVLLAGDVPELAEAVDGVRADRAAAAAALAGGDTLAAVRHLSAASVRARREGPAAVALRLFERAEAAVRGSQLARADSLRAERLLHHAREAILTGEPGRAFHRAAYALQLAGAAR